MSKKLLEEQAVRKFMKIAGLQPLTNTFLKESEEVSEEKELEEAKDESLEESVDGLEEGYGSKDKDKMEEGKEELEEGGGQMPFDEQSRRADERAPVAEAKMTASVKGKGAKQGSHKLSKTSVKHKNGSSGKSLVKEEDMGDDAELETGSDSAMGAEEAPAASGGMDTQALVKALIDAIVAHVPGAADEVSVEEESDEGTEVEMGGEEPAPAPEVDAKGGDDALDEAALETVVAETVKRVKARLQESVSKPDPKAALAKKVAQRVVERLKKS